MSKIAYTKFYTGPLDHFGLLHLHIKMRYIKLFCVSYYTYYDEVLLFWTLPEKLSPFLLFSSDSPVQTSHRLQTDPIGGKLALRKSVTAFYNTRAGYGNHISSLH